MWLMRTLIVALTISLSFSARSAEESIVELERCFGAATRFADEVCSNPSNTPMQRSSCFQKARTAQLQCLERAPVEARASSEPAVTYGISQKLEDEACKSSAPPGNQTGAAVPSIPLEPPEVRPAVASLQVQSVNSPASNPGNTASVVEASPNGAWIISDQSSVVSAKIRSTQDTKAVPSVLAMSCGRSGMEIKLQTVEGWHPTKQGLIKISFEANNKVSSSSWNLSSDGKTAFKLTGANKLLQSLPDRGELRVRVSDRLDHVASFQLAGLAVVRAKVLSRCKSDSGQFVQRISMGKQSPEPGVKTPAAAMLPKSSGTVSSGGARNPAVGRP